MKKIILLTIVLSLLLASCGENENSSAEESVASETVSVESSADAESSVSDESSESEESAESGEAEESSKNSEDMESSEEASEEEYSDSIVPENIKNTASGKALSGLSKEKGISYTLKKELDGETYETVSVSMKGKNTSVKVDMDLGDGLGMSYESIILDGVAYNVDNDEKTYYICDPESLDMSSADLFKDLQYVAMEEKLVDGVLYYVDFFRCVEEFEEDGDYSSMVLFYNLGNEIKFIDRGDGLCRFELGDGSANDLVSLPTDYTKRTLGNEVKEYFAVPEALKETKIGKLLSSLDFENGFTVVTVEGDTSDLESVITNVTGIKGEAVYVISTYASSEGADSSYTLYKDGFSYYIYEAEKKYDKYIDTIGEGLYVMNYLDGYEFVETKNETIDGVDYVVEVFNDGFYDRGFYFDGDELKIIKDDEIVIGISFKDISDESLFKLPSGYKEA